MNHSQAAIPLLAPERDTITRIGRRHEIADRLP
jgi:hypothetical protein